MGARNSTEPRSVSMDNPNPSGVIDVSDDVVQRLKLGITKQVKENAAAEHAAETKSSQSQKQQETRAIPVKKAPAPAPAPVPAPAPAPPVRSPPLVFQNPAPAYLHVAPGATMTALDMRRQKEIELQQNDTMWRERMTQQEQMLKETDSILEREYNSAMTDVRNRFAHASPVHQLPPCQDLKARVIACYRANPGETLKCAEEVCMFRHCVSMQRVKILDSDKEEKKLTVKPLANASDKNAAAKAA